MSKNLFAADVEALETLIDRYTLAEVLASLYRIADGKAEHIRVNWQDAATARPWSRLARKVENAAIMAEKEGV